MVLDVSCERSFEKHLRNVREGHVHDVIVLPSLAEFRGGFEVPDSQYLVEIVQLESLSSAQCETN